MKIKWLIIIVTLMFTKDSIAIEAQDVAVEQVLALTAQQVLDKQLIDACCDGGDLAALTLAFNQGANINALDPFMDSTALHITSYNENLECLNFLLDNGANIEVQDEDGRTPLYIACMFGKIDVARLLLSHGANVNAPNKKMKTPLHMACYSKWQRLDIVQLLLEYKADINAQEKWGETPLHYACQDVTLNSAGYVIALTLIKHNACRCACAHCYGNPISNIKNYEAKDALDRALLKREQVKKWSEIKQMNPHLFLDSET